MIKRLAIALLLGSAPLSQPAGAADQEEIHSLVGLPGVYVTVQNLNPAAEAFGLESDKIRGEVELKLRQHHVPVLNIAQMRKQRGLPIFKVLINVHKTEAGFFVYAVDLAVEQTVQLVRRPSIQTYAPTWKSGSLGVVSENQLANIKELVLQATDEFTADFDQANPEHRT